MAEYYDPVPSKIRFSAALGLFIGGFVFFAVFFAIPSHPNYLALPGWTAWIFAYFIVVARNLREKHQFLCWVYGCVLRNGPICIG